MRDIDKTKRQLVTELGKAGEKLRAMFESTAIGVAVTDLELNITDVNEAGVRLHGYSNKAELIGRNGMELLSKKEHARAIEDMGRTLEAGRSAMLEYTLLTKDGKEFPGGLSVAVLKDMSGNPTGFVVITRDITKRKHVERDLLQSRERYKRLFELSPIGIITLDMKGVITSCNPSISTQCGHYAADLVGKNFLKVVPIQTMYIPQFTNAIASTIKGKAPKPFEVTYRRRDRTTGWCEVHTALIKANGEKQGVLVLLSDITERKRREEAVQESEEKYRGLVNNIKLGIFRSTPGPTGRLLEVNPATEEITGYSREELLQINVSDLYVHPKEREAVLEEITAALGKSSKELNFRKKDGTEIIVSSTTVPVRDSTGEILYFDGIVEDITERKRLEKEMRELYEAEKGRQGEPGEE